MYRASLIINEIYNKFLPLAEQNGVRIDLDISDPEIVENEITEIKKDVEKTLSDAINRSSKGQITISLSEHKITITDTGTVLSKLACDLLSSKHVQVSSRVGFGTKAQIMLERSEKVIEPRAED